MFDTLENRTFFNGTVRVTIDDESIRMTGDRAGNLVRLEAADGRENSSPAFFVVPEVNTRLIINGDVRSVSGVIAPEGRPLFIDLGSGEDRLITGSRPTFGETTIAMGPGNDFFDSYATFDSLTVDGGDHDDRIIIRGGVVSTGNVDLFPGAGRDQVLFASPAETLIEGKLLIRDRQGPLTVSATGLFVKRETTIATGNSIDRITINNSRFGRFTTIDTRGNDDVIDVRGTRFRRGRDLSPGEGDNTVEE
jgi:hypothetical protein